MKKWIVWNIKKVAEIDSPQLVGPYTNLTPSDKASLIAGWKRCLSRVYNVRRTDVSVHLIDRNLVETYLDAYDWDSADRDGKLYQSLQNRTSYALNF